MYKLTLSHTLTIYGYLVAMMVLSTTVQATPYLWQTNSYGNDIHIYNLNTFELVRRLEVGAHPHGIAVPDDKSVFYVSLERHGQPHGELLWINPVSLEVERRLKTCKEPQNIAITPDGKWLYVPCKNGQYWVVDTDTGITVKKIATGGRPHNVKPSSDGRYMYLSPLGSPVGVTVIDVQAGHQMTGFIAFCGQVRPLDVSRDGQLLFQQVDGVFGFKVADTTQRAVLTEVQHSTSVEWFHSAKKLINRVSRRFGFEKPFTLPYCHGLGVRPDQKEVWATCGSNLNIHNLDRGNYGETAHLNLDGTGYWLSFSPDSRYAAVALADLDQVAIVDTHDKRIVRLLAVGNRPKRNIIIDHRIQNDSVDH